MFGKICDFVWKSCGEGRQSRKGERLTSWSKWWTKEMFKLRRVCREHSDHSPLTHGFEAHEVWLQWSFCPTINPSLPFQPEDRLSSSGSQGKSLYFRLSAGCCLQTPGFQTVADRLWSEKRNRFQRAVNCISELALGGHQRLDYVKLQ